eukprot:scaffold858_cov171-Ochromonas_danica.AAC.2
MHVDPQPCSFSIEGIQSLSSLFSLHDLIMICPADLEEFSSFLEIENSVYDNVYWFMHLKDKTTNLNYERFYTNNQTIFSFFRLNVIFLAFCIPTMIQLICSVLFDTNGHSGYEIADFIFCLILTVVLSILMWVAYYHFDTLFQKHKANTPKDSLKQLRTIQRIVYFVCNLAAIYRLISKVATGQCKSDVWFTSWLCNPTAKAGLLPLDVTIVLMLLPLLYSVVVKGPEFYMIFGTWTLNLTAIVVAIVYSDLRESTSFVLMEVWREKEKAADVANALEMRHMIANVAHDLKTPLSSFYGGVEYIAHVLDDIANKYEKDEEESPDAKCDAIFFQHFDEFLTSVRACLSNMRNTNSFMLMTINRCIDYTKTSKGMKLSPKLETIDLVEALSLPLHCMQDVQQRIKIVLEPWPHDEICSHIITDKQWLQENILCLLSNAVKYSIEGEVRVRISKEMETCLSDRLDEERQAVLRIEVEDQGIGLREEEMLTLFSPFRQTQRLAGGTGLGLFSLAKRMEALEGRYGVLNPRDEQQGSLFWFEIPYRPDGQASTFLRPQLSKVTSVLTAVPDNSDKPSCSKTRSDKPMLAVPASNEHAHGKSPNERILDRFRMITTEDRTLKEETQQIAHNEQDGKLNAELKVPSGPGSALGGTIPPTPWNILVVEDSPAILKMTTLMLRRHRHQVTIATNGAEAVKMVRDQVRGGGQCFDMILMDMQMPVMDGLEATRRLRAMETRRRLSSLSVNSHSNDDHWSLLVSNFHHIIIGLSANSDSETMQEAFRAGIDGFLTKPFSLDSLYLSWQKINQEIRISGESNLLK